MNSMRINIMLIVIDTLRYDYSLKVFSNIVPKHHGAIVFHNAFSTSTWTPPAHASIFTGRYPHQHGVLAWGEGVVPPLRVSSLASRLRLLEYNTYAVTANPAVPPFIGKGFSHVIEVNVGKRRFLHFSFPIVPLRAHYDPNNKFIKMIRKIIRGSYHLLTDIITLSEKYFGSQVVNQVIFNLFKSRVIKKPFFMFINYMDVHDYLAYMKFLNRCRTKITIHSKILAGAYQKACMNQAQALRELFDFLDKIGLLDSSAIIITSDHGELLGEGGLVGHRNAYPFNELIHVPLAIYNPFNTKRIELTKIISIKEIFNIALRYAQEPEQPVAEYVKKLPEYVVVEDRTIGVKGKHYRAIIIPPI